MIPLRDASRTPVRFPVVTVSLIAVNVLAFIWEVANDEAAIIRWAVVPAELPRGQGWITPFTAMFLHGGVMHIISNMVFLAAFAPVVEDAMGAGNFSSSTSSADSRRRPRKSAWIHRPPSRSLGRAEP